MDFKDNIKNYNVYNEQEESDKELILYVIDNFNNSLKRENKIAHFTSSAFVLNEKRNKVLMVYHNIYNSWSWIGGHCDGDGDFKRVAFKELEEETGVKNAKLINEDIFSLDVLPVKAHLKNNKFVSSHLHLSIAYLIETNENEHLRIKEDENSAIKWIEIDRLLEYTKSEPHMQVVYKKFIEKIDYMHK